ncbi:MAG: hypothetical protein ACYC56_13470 [Candidatus Aquicultor sp.]
MKGNRPHSEIVQKILSFLLISGALVIAPPMTPRVATMLWKAVFKKLKPSKSGPLPIYRLVKSNYIEIIKTKTETRIELTEKGKQIAQSFLYNSNHKKAMRWDKLWRVVMYDIPSKHKQERDDFRKKVKELGMYQLQKSVWIYPYDCKEEIQFLCDILSISYKKHILYFETKEVPGMNELRKIFGI